MTKRPAGAYIGGHTIVRMARPWWQPEDISLKDTGHLNSDGQLASDRTILRRLALITFRLQRRRSRSDNLRDADAIAFAGCLLREKGADAAIHIIVARLSKELLSQPKEIKFAVEHYLQSKKNRPIAPFFSKGRARPSKRERQTIRDRVRSLGQGLGDVRT